MQLTPSHYKLGFIAAAVFSLAACGGGGGGATSALATPPAPVAMTSVTTTVMDGLIENALVCVDANSNGLCETTETQGRTNAAGQVTLAISTAALATTHLVAVVGLDAVDADTGPITTAYTLQTPAGKHSVISPLTHMVKTKIDADKASGITTSIVAAENFVKAQTNLTVSVFDNFIATRDTDAAARKAGEVARVLVVSTQESKKASTVTSACGPAKSQDKVREHDDEDGHAKGARIDDDLINRLPEIRKLTDDMASTCSSKSGKSSKDAIKACDSDYKRKAPIAPTCATPVPAPTPTPTPTPTVSAANGKVVYNTAFAGMSCATCHTASPALNVSKVLRGANSANSILNAINNNTGGMGLLKGAYTTSQLNEVAAYLATPGI